MSLFRLRPGFSRSGLTPRAYNRFQSSSAGVTLSEENELAKMRKSVTIQSFLNPSVNPDLSPEMRQKLSKEFDGFLQEFVHDVDPSLRSAEYLAEKVSGVDAQAFGQMYNARADNSVDGNMKGRGGFSSVNSSDFDQNYTVPEMYVRQLFHARRIASLGAEVKDIYKPHEDLHKPKAIEETGISTLLASGAHLGHAVNRVRANCLPFVYGVKSGIHIIDLQQTLAALRRSTRIAEELARKGGLFLFVGTREDQKRTVQKAAERCRGYYVSDRWVPGTFTNYQTISEQKQQVKRLEIDMADSPTGRQLSPSLYDTIVKPDLVVVFNPVENRALLSECIRMRIPTMGIVDTDSEPTLLTYAIPGNDDSLRFTDLVAGVLSLAARRGRASRMREFRQLQEAKEKLKQGQVFDAAEGVDNSTADPVKGDITSAELEILRESS